VTPSNLLFWATIVVQFSYNFSVQRWIKGRCTVWHLQTCSTWRASTPSSQLSKFMLEMDNLYSTHAEIAKNLRKFVNVEQIRFHLITRGFVKDYTIWSKHVKVRMFRNKPLMMWSYMTAPLRLLLTRKWVSTRNLWLSMMTPTSRIHELTIWRWRSLPQNRIALRVENPQGK